MEKTLREQFEQEIKAKLPNEILFESSNQNYISWLESKLNVDRTEFFSKDIETLKVLHTIYSGCKTVLVLDKNFHVYVHSHPHNVKLDFDSDGKFLKLYFENIK